MLVMMLIFFVKLWSLFNFIELNLINIVTFDSVLLTHIVCVLRLSLTLSLVNNEC